jgi:hypothetical protein
MISDVRARSTQGKGHWITDLLGRTGGWGVRVGRDIDDDEEVPPSKGQRFRNQR